MFPENIKITDAKLQENINLVIHFSSSWQQEDIPCLVKAIMRQLIDITVVEKIQGADRETVRLLYQKQYFSLNFELYSESCWLSVEGINEHLLLPEIASILTGKH
jgi:hypothetical protein